MAKNRLNNEGVVDQSARLIINHNFSDVALCTTQLDAVTGTTGTTLTNIPGMVTDNLIAGITYKFKIELYTVATANTGIKFGFKFGTASMLTSISYNAKAFTASGVATLNGTTATDQALLLDSAAGVVTSAIITGVLVVAVGGTLQLQMAQHTAHADTTSTLINSMMSFEEVRIG